MPVLVTDRAFRRYDVQALGLPRGGESFTPKLRLGNPRPMQALRDTLGKPYHGDRLGIRMGRIEKDKVACSIDRIKSKDREIAVVFASMGTTRDEGGFASNPATKIVPGYFSGLGIDPEHGVEGRE